MGGSAPVGGSLTRSMLAGMIGFLDLQQNSVENWYFNDTISDHPALVNGKLQMWLISGRNPSQMRQIFDVFHHVFIVCCRECKRFELEQAIGAISQLDCKRDPFV